ncbi:hypothetical protein C8R46DRAFT_1101907 [Mycena filopes]|nr:hypothetical protein C8R46DRAFT_1101907 [Mycena filopes]
MAPTPTTLQSVQITAAADNLGPLIECSGNSSVPTLMVIIQRTGGLIFIFFLLVFYALALWDRWLNLKLRESQKLMVQYTAAPPRMYGAIQEHSRSPSPSPPPIARSSVRFPSPAPPAAADKVNLKAPELNQTQKDDQRPSHLAPPPFYTGN